MKKKTKGSQKDEKDSLRVDTYEAVEEPKKEAEPAEGQESTEQNPLASEVLDASSMRNKSSLISKNRRIASTLAAENNCILSRSTRRLTFSKSEAFLNSWSFVASSF
jgi:hypothetical protein